jgi:UDP-glucuronate 4-epimerase
MALFKFTRAILTGETIDVHGHGQMQRDFTYIDDLVEGIVRLIDCPPANVPVSGHDSLSPAAPFRTVNIGNGTPVGLTDFIAAVEDALGQKAKKRMVPIFPGEAVATWADATLIGELTGPLPRTELHDGVRRFVDWYRDYHGV